MQSRRQIVWGGLLVASIVLLALAAQAERHEKRRQAQRDQDRLFGKNVRVAWQLQLESTEGDRTDNHGASITKTAAGEVAAEAVVAAPEEDVPVVAERPVLEMDLPSPLPPVDNQTAALRDDVFRLSSNIEVWLRHIRIGLGQNAAAIQKPLDALAAQTAELTRAAASGATATTLRSEFHDVDLLWKPLVQQLESLPSKAEWTSQRVVGVERSLDMLRGLLNTAAAAKPAPAGVSELTAQLAVATEELSRRVQGEVPGVADDAALRRFAHRVHLQAANLAATVADGAGLTAIADAYDAFDVSWHGFVRWTEAAELPLEVRKAGSRIWQLDQQLHRALRIESPLYSEAERTAALATSVVDMSRRLPNLIRIELGTQGDEILTAAEDFATAAETFHLWQQTTSQPVTVIEDRVVNMMAAWRRLDNQLKRLEATTSPMSIELADQLEPALRELHAHLAANPSGADQ